MNVLWAPWRMAYLQGGATTSGCLFCAMLAAGDDPGHLILTRSPTAFLVLNAFPYASGHLMAVVNRHVGTLDELTDEEQGDLMRLAGRGLAAVRAEYRPDGFNVGANIGRAAGAGVDGHLHLHVVPRWTGDTNFMPVVADTKVMPQHLLETYDRLRPAFGWLGL